MEVEHSIFSVKKHLLLQQSVIVKMVPPSFTPGSPEVQGQSDGENNAHEHHERQPGLQEAHAAVRITEQKRR